MKEVKSPKKPLLYYYGIVLLVLVLFNVVLTPMLSMKQVREVDYGTFMSRIEDKKIDNVQIEDNQILFTEKDSKNTVYKTGLMEDATLTERLYESGAKFQRNRCPDVACVKFPSYRSASSGNLYCTGTVYG